MSSPNDRKVEFELNAKDNASAVVKGLSEKMNGLKSTMSGLSGTLDTVKGGFLALAAAMGVNGFKDKIKEITEMGSKIGEFSERTGVAAEDLQKLNFAASQNGSGIESVGEAISKLNRKLGAARNGDTGAKNLFKHLGIDLESTKDAKDALLQLADGFKEIGDDPEGLQAKAAILKAMKLPADLIPMLSQGSDGIKGFGDQLEKMGGVIDNETISSMKDLKDKMDAIEVRSKATSAQLVSGLEPALNKIATAFMDTRGSAAAFKGIGEILGDTIIRLITLGTKVVDVFGKVGRTLGAAAAAISIQLGDESTDEFKNRVTRKKNETEEQYRKRINQYGQSKNEALGEVFQNYNEDNARNLGVTEAIRNSINGGSSSSKEAGAGGGSGSSGTTARGKGKINIAAVITKDKEEASARATALAAFEKAQAEASANLKIAQEKRAQDIIKQQLEDGTISYKDYYDSITALQQTSIDDRIKALQTEIAAQKKVLGSDDAKESEKLKAKGEIAKAEGKINELMIERGAVEQDAARAQTLAERELLIELDKVALKTAEILGTATPEQRIAATKEQYRVLRQKAQQAGKDTSGIDKAESLDNAKAIFDDLQRKNDLARSAASQKIDAINTDLAGGSISSSEARQKIAAANEELRKSIEDSIPALEEQAKILGPEYAQKIEGVQIEVKKLKNATDEVANSINRELVDGLSSAIYDVSTGSKSPAEALKAMFAGVGSSIGKQVADDLASDLYKSMKNSGFDFGGMMSNLLNGGGSGDSGGSGGMLSKVAGLFGFSSGGYTGYGGVGDVAGVVHGQEYVMSAPAVRSLGVGFLDALHSTARRGAPSSRLGGFANGGFTGNGRGSQGGTTVIQNITTKDAESFRRSQGQIQAQTGTAVDRALRRYA